MPCVATRSTTALWGSHARRSMISVAAKRTAKALNPHRCFTAGVGCTCDRTWPRGVPAGRKTGEKSASLSWQVRLTANLRDLRPSIPTLATPSMAQTPCRRLSLSRRALACCAPRTHGVFFKPNLSSPNIRSDFHQNFGPLGLSSINPYDVVVGQACQECPGECVALEVGRAMMCLRSALSNCQTKS
jgi:hypothetical protein